MDSWEAQSLPLSSYPEVCSVTNTTSMNTTVIIDPANLASQIAGGALKISLFFPIREQCVTDFLECLMLEITVKIQEHLGLERWLSG